MQIMIIVEVKFIIQMWLSYILVFILAKPLFGVSKNKT